ncbi:MAG: cytidine deaminase [Planctomycetota bacterium]|nr:cytidine deaminase [Planctomycetota bacterium]
MDQRSEDQFDPGPLLEAARHQATHARAPYSRFHVGAALWSDSRIFGGCNVENASYGLTICAERGAVMNWAAAGSPGVPLAIAIAACSMASGEWVEAMPCGACRQVLNELPGANQLRVWIWDGEGGKSTTLRELLPHSFGPSQLGIEEG